MFWPYCRRGATVILLTLGTAHIAQAQVATPTDATLSGTVIFHVTPAEATTPAAKAAVNALLADVSAAAGIPYNAGVPAGAATAAVDPPEPPLCIRTGLGLAIPALNTPLMTMEHGVVGCPTETAGMPFVLTRDPALQPPIDSRTGDYNLDVTVRYRLLQARHMELLANASAQAIGYSLDEPVRGNNVMLSVSLIF